ncbi:MAG TPA: ABC transporter permease [Gaiellaceae bacterium]|jgi:ABC-type transport system involved in multi-copper enzyme maturation permease subunit|nr:ABC transporter permease [Gaiellaceae bacterium]
MNAIAQPTALTGSNVVRGKLTFPHVIRSEWTKLTTLRSTRWTMLVAVVLTIGLPSIFAAITANRWSHMSIQDKLDRQPLDIALAGVRIPAPLAIGILAVLVITGEYSTGMIRASLTAVPKRLPVLWAKLLVFAVTAFALMLPSTLIAFFATQAILDRHHILQISFSSGGVARSVIGGAVYLMMLGILALSLGAIARNTAAGIGIFAAIFFVIPPLLLILPSNWHDAISGYMPDAAGVSIFSLTHGAHELAPWPGFFLFLGYCTVAVVTAAILLVRRDA